MKPPQGLNEGGGTRPGRREINDGPHRRREHLISAREEERRRPGRDPHGRIGAPPAGARPGLGAPEARRPLTGAASGTGRLIDRIRRVVGDPGPPEPTGSGPSGAPSRPAARPDGMPVTVTADVPPRPDTARGTLVRAVLPWRSR
jgi:hypothetical protein